MQDRRWVAHEAIGAIMPQPQPRERRGLARAALDWHRWGSGSDWGLAVTHPWLKNRRSDAAVGPPEAHLGSIAEGSGRGRYPFRRVDLATCLAESRHRFLSRSARQVCFRLRPLPAGSPRSPPKSGSPPVKQFTGLFHLSTPPSALLPRPLSAPRDRSAARAPLPHMKLSSKTWLICEDGDRSRSPRPRCAS